MSSASDSGSSSNNFIKFTDEQLRKRLTDLQYRVTQEKHTERPFTGKFLNIKENGIFKCIVCGQNLFKTDKKFDSGCGWLSFNDVLAQNTIKALPDHSLGMQRVEVVCSRCDAHLGHVFDDGPLPTKLRYCINSASVDFEKT